MKKKIYFLSIVAFFVTSGLGQDLSGLKFCFDPGHGGHESDDRHMVFADFWESESNLSKAFQVKEIFENLGATVILTRYANNDDVADDPSLSERAAIANANNVDFFHSIHSNGWNGERNSTLILYPGPRNDPRINGLSGYPSCPIELICANEMAEQVYSSNRTTGWTTDGDWTFYGTGQPYLGVFRTLKLPGVLSEGSFHDYPPETWRLKNSSYHRNEAYAFARTYLQLFDSTDFQYATLAGIVRDAFEKVSYFSLNSTSDKYLPINHITVTLSPGGKVYHGDDQNNGYFLFDSLSAGDYEIIVTAPDYLPDTANVNIGSKFFNFKDFKLLKDKPSWIISTVPADGDTNIPAADPVRIRFSYPMDTASVRAAISMVPAVPFEIQWGNENSQMTISSDSLDYLAEYTITIAETALNIVGYQLDGDGDGIAGGGYTFSFKTGPEDMTGPVLVTSLPRDNTMGIELFPVINIMYDEMIDTAYFDEDMFVLVKVADGDTIPATVVHYYVSERSTITLFPLEALEPETIYRVKISAGLRDIPGNISNEDKSIRFKTGTESWIVRNIDNFETGLTSNWRDAKFSGSNAGLIDTVVERSENSEYVNCLTNSRKSMRLRYGWDRSANSWLFREYLGGGVPRSVTFNDSYLLQAYVFGDGSRTLFRFALDDNYPSTAAVDHEVSPWYVIDWIGWKLVSWDMSSDGTGVWLGDGNLDGTLRFDSIQLSYDPNDPEAGMIGEIYVDDLRLVTVSTSETTPDNRRIAEEFTLHQNYPNPFNPATNIAFTLATATAVRLDIYNIRGEKVRSLIQGNYKNGYHTVVWNGLNDAGNMLPSGVYLYRLITDRGVQVRTMLMVK
ncbi:MAG: Ig-like domain-containing protein [Fidelibacterota bacterium]